MTSRPGRRPDEAPADTRTLRRRRLLVLAGLVIAAGVIAATVTNLGGDDGDEQRLGRLTEALRNPAPPNDGVLPARVPDGFVPFELRLLPNSSPFGADASVQLRVFGAAKGGDALGGGDLGVAIIRAAGLADARGFSPDHSEVTLGDRTAFRSSIPVGPAPLRLLVWDVGDGAVALAGTHTLGDDQLDALVGAVTVDEAGLPALPAGAVPAGLQQVAAGEGSFVLLGGAPREADGYEAEYYHQTEPERRLVVSRWRGDTEWEPMLRWWFGSPATTIAVGEAQAQVRTISATPPRMVMVTWQAGEHATMLVGVGVADADVVAAARSLRRASDDDWAAFTRQGGGSGPIPSVVGPSAPSPTGG